MPVEAAAAPSFRQDLIDTGIVIHTEDLWKTYEMGSEQVHALRGITLEIRKGEYVAIMGPSGSGKSTLMNLIGCLDTPSSGRYYLAGRLVSDLDDDELAYKMCIRDRTNWRLRDKQLLKEPVHDDWEENRDRSGRGCGFGYDPLGQRLPSEQGRYRGPDGIYQARGSDVGGHSLG